MSRWHATTILAGCALADKDVTGDALLTQRALVRYLIKRPEHYYFTVRKT